ncbi:MAG: hypothetical protein CMK07_04660 [Ponticaulis sp.]|nr:hypothetical protein [Ponticaulis sp.]
MAYVSDTNRETGEPKRNVVSNWLRPLVDRRYSLISPLTDAIVFYATPLWCVLLFWAFSETPLWYTMEAFSYEHGPLSFLAAVLTTAHLLSVVFRSHFNTQVFKQWPLRFTVIPIALFLALAISKWFLVISAVVIVFWDVWHGAMQNFGLSRIYDARIGNDPKAGRLLDSLMNLVLYAGPILAGVMLAFHLSGFDSFAEIGLYALTAIPGETLKHANLIRWITIAICLCFIAFYIFRNWQMARQGYRVSPQKVILLSSTGLASIIAWGFNPAAIAFAAMNIFHAIQYFGILYAREGKNVLKLTRLEGIPKPLRPWTICLILLLPTMLFGVWEFFASPGWDMTLALIFTVTMLHYWYDGFIWSVRKKQV